MPLCPCTRVLHGLFVANKQTDFGGRKSKRCQHFFVCIGIAAAVASIVVGFTIMFDSFKTPIYSATITAVSGLDPETDLRQQRRAWDQRDRTQCKIMVRADFFLK
jgi:hypothetical protein